EARPAQTDTHISEYLVTFVFSLHEALCLPVIDAERLWNTEDLAGRERNKPRSRIGACDLRSQHFHADLYAYFTISKKPDQQTLRPDLQNSPRTISNGGTLLQKNLKSS